MMSTEESKSKWKQLPLLFDGESEEFALPPIFINKNEAIMPFNDSMFRTVKLTKYDAIANKLQLQKFIANTV